jgi:hypothetical protein
MKYHILSNKTTDSTNNRIVPKKMIELEIEVNLINQIYTNLSTSLTNAFKYFIWERISSSIICPGFTNAFTSEYNSSRNSLLLASLYKIKCIVVATFICFYRFIYRKDQIYFMFSHYSIQSTCEKFSNHRLNIAIGDVVFLFIIVQILHYRVIFTRF